MTKVAVAKDIRCKAIAVILQPLPARSVLAPMLKRRVFFVLGSYRIDSRSAFVESSANTHSFVAPFAKTP